MPRVLFLPILSLFLASAGHGEPVRWQQFAEDLEAAEVRLEDTLLVAPLVIIRTSLVRYQPMVIRAAEHGDQRAFVDTLCRQSHAIACINANFFDENGDPLGLVISRGQTRQKMHRGGQTLTGVFFSTRNRTGILNRSDFGPGSWLEAVQAGPRLLQNGEPIKGLKDTGRYRRSGVCIDSAARLLLYVTGTGFRGLSLDEVQILLRRPGVDCLDALNFDGGGSAQLFVGKNVPGAANGLYDMLINGRDPVPVALGLFLK